MARGDECKTATKANNASKNWDIPAPLQKSSASSAYDTYKTTKQEPKKDYGVWGSIYKDKKTFTEMHLC